MTRTTKNHDLEGTSVKTNEVRFYRANEKPYGVFSNLYLRPIEFEGEIYASAEHAYQAGKAAKQSVRKWLLSAPSPALLAMAAHGLYTWDIVPDWATSKFGRMKNVLLAKYRQHLDLRELLLSTADSRLVESATTNNAINRLWGEVNGKGENMLGKLLMEVRGELQKDILATTKKKSTKSDTAKPRTTVVVRRTPATKSSNARKSI